MTTPNNQIHAGLRSTWRISLFWLPEMRTSVQRSLLRLLHIAHVERLELVPLINALALEHRGGNRSRLRRLAIRLAGGLPLIEALEQTPDALADEDVLTLRFARQTGTTAAALNDLANRSTAVADDTKIRLFRMGLYFACVGAFAWIILILMMFFIAPTFIKISEEFGLESWPRFEFLRSFVLYLIYFGPLTIVTLIVLVMASSRLKPLRILRHSLASGLLRPVGQLRTAHLMRALALAVESGRPVPGALSTLARHHFDNRVRAKLLFARNEVEQGAAPWQSLAGVRLISSAESSALATASSPSNRVWLLNRLAQWKEDQVAQRRTIFVSLIHPTVILLFGVLVLWVGLAFFGFITQMITSLS